MQPTHAATQCWRERSTTAHNTLASTTPSFINHTNRVQVSKFPLAAMFGMCALFLGVCAMCQVQLDRLSVRRVSSEESIPLTAKI